VNAAAAVLALLVFPGLLFAAVAGLSASWLDRKVTARVQMRAGPPLLQPFWDVAKLMIKETCLPERAPAWLFLAAPLPGLAGAAAASAIVWQALLDPARTFVGDVIVVLALVTLPALSVVLGAFASGNALASLGGSREMKVVLAYEPPLVLALLVPVLHAHSLRLGDILSIPAPATATSGLLALGIAVLCTQAKLGLVPFDVAEAETELTGGALIEYSGPPLAMFKLTRAMMLATLPALLVALFAGGFGRSPDLPGVFRGVAAMLGIVVVTTLIRNTAPRLRIDQIVRFFWGPVSVAAVAAILLAWKGW
jgi:NADH-quinone oxidoreductase subunit H